MKKKLKLARSNTFEGINSNQTSALALTKIYNEHFLSQIPAMTADKKKKVDEVLAL